MRKDVMNLNILRPVPFIGPLLGGILNGTKVLQVTTPAVPNPVEPKVIATTAATSITGLLLGVLTPLLTKLPAPVRWVASAILPGLITAATGYFAPKAARTPV
jgi:VIT1/CCC1 family predicted Fe2+/Mn2+ transporter